MFWVSKFLLGRIQARNLSGTYIIHNTYIILNNVSGGFIECLTIDDSIRYLILFIMKI